MLDGVPNLVAIEPDNHHAEHVGRTANGNQFFLTTPFDPAHGGYEGCEFVALYVFDARGKLVDAVIDSLGPRATMDNERRQQLYDERLGSLGDGIFCRIEVAPFSVERFGLKFGLVLRVPEDEDDIWAVEMQPGNYMAFFDPWDSGDYDT